MKLRAMTWTLLALVPAPVSGQEPPTVTSILAEYDRLADHVVWPGFIARHVPLAVYDGTATWLARHPNPPAEFTRDTSAAGHWRMEGRHPGVRANTSVDIGGDQTATIVLDGTRSRSPTQYAALLIHEAFHVFQHAKHPSWGGNEVELFTYPMASESVLVHRRLETVALDRSLNAADPELAACWAREALLHRRARFQHLTPGAIQYERGTELLEGLAEYVEFRSVGRNPATVFSVREFRADDVRERSYATGTALALLLDRFRPGWMAELEERDGTLDDLLADVTAVSASASCGLSEEEHRATARWAEGAITDLRARRSVLRNRVFTEDGWSVVVIPKGDDVLFPTGFDPLNVSVVGETEVVHTRLLDLKNAAGSLEVIGRAVLTEGMGPHPLFNGVRRVRVSGLPNEPAVQRIGDDTLVSGDGVQARFTGARVTREGTTITISLR